MPYWEIFTPENAFTPEDKEQLSEAITSIYVGLRQPASVLRGRPVQGHAGEQHVRRRKGEQQLRPDPSRSHRPEWGPQRFAH